MFSTTEDRWHQEEYQRLVTIDYTHLDEWWQGHAREIHVFIQKGNFVDDDENNELEDEENEVEQNRDDGEGEEGDEEGEEEGDDDEEDDEGSKGDENDKDDEGGKNEDKEGAEEIEGIGVNKYGYEGSTDEDEKLAIKELKKNIRDSNY
ncbi:hypothetical protein C1645_841179 [Glomus cerebriforme]|uniref:Uncharacterized protein n=1 Tax=Glomus cerebriforme TaxID=658196 RepID=A0A397S133_9GLOM|nr:hypothetical protein C1645_841179 [Glomus cerebriforme]